LIGVTVLIVGVYFFNYLFFVEPPKRELRDLPLYSRYVVLPVFLGTIATIDGLVAMHVKRDSSFVLYVVGSVVWLYSVSLLHNNLLGLVYDASRYQLILIFFLASVVILVVGAIADSVPSRHYRRESSNYRSAHD